MPEMCIVRETTYKKPRKVPMRYAPKVLSRSRWVVGLAMRVL